MELQVEMSKRILPKDCLRISDRGSIWTQFEHLNWIVPGQKKKEKKIKGKGELKVVERRGDTGRRKKEKGRRGDMA